MAADSSDWKAYHPSGIDRAALEELLQVTLDKDANVYCQIIEMFLGDSPLAYQKLQTQIQEKNWTEIISISHSLKGNGLALGALHFSFICHEIESLCRKHLDTETKVSNTTEEKLLKSVKNLSQMVKTELDLCVNILNLEVQKHRDAA